METSKIAENQLFQVAFISQSIKIAKLYSRLLYTPKNQPVVHPKPTWHLPPQTKKKIAPFKPNPPSKQKNWPRNFVSRIVPSQLHVSLAPFVHPGTPTDVDISWSFNHLSPSAQSVGILRGNLNGSLFPGNCSHPASPPMPFHMHR